MQGGRIGFLEKWPVHRGNVEFYVPSNPGFLYLPVNFQERFNFRFSDRKSYPGIVLPMKCLETRFLGRVRVIKHTIYLLHFLCPILCWKKTRLQEKITPTRSSWIKWSLSSNIIVAIKSGFTRLSITKNKTKKNTQLTPLIYIYFGRLCHHQELHETETMLHEFRVTPDDDIVCRNIYIESVSCVFLWFLT
jgi:hypothetical protein